MTTPDYFGENLTPAEREQERAEREQRQALENKRLGMLIFQISWMMAFASLVMVNWQLRFQYESWPPPNVQAMGVFIPSIATVLLLGVALAARRARRAIAADDVPGMTRFLWGALLAGGVFILMMAYEWWRVGGVDVENTQYQSVFRLMTGFHMLHTLVIGVLTASVLNDTLHAQRHPGRADAVHFDRDNHWIVEAVSKLWDFVFIAWLLFYVVLYWWRSA